MHTVELNPVEAPSHAKTMTTPGPKDIVARTKSILSEKAGSGYGSTGGDNAAARTERPIGYGFSILAIDISAPIQRTMQLGDGVDILKSAGVTDREALRSLDSSAERNRTPTRPARSWMSRLLLSW